MRTNNLLSRHTVTEIFTAVYVLVDDYLKASVSQGRFSLPEKPNQKGSYSELFTIVLVGEILQQKNQGLWYMLVQSEYKDLFPVLPDLSRFYHIGRNFERLYADLALLIAQHDGVYLIDSKPLPICKGVRHKRERLMTEAVKGRGGATRFFYGFKRHALTNPSGYFCRFGIVPANEHDVSVAQSLLDEGYDDFESILGDKGYQGLGIYTPPKVNAKQHTFWCGFFAKARKSIESAFSSLARSRNLALQQLNSFWSVRASVCRKIAAHNLSLFLFN
jgi:Transposase DDE domain